MNPKGIIRLISIPDEKLPTLSDESEHFIEWLWVNTTAVFLIQTLIGFCLVDSSIKCSENQLLLKSNYGTERVFEVLEDIISVKIK